MPLNYGMISTAMALLLLCGCAWSGSGKRIALVKLQPGPAGPGSLAAPLSQASRLGPASIDAAPLSGAPADQTRVASAAGQVAALAGAKPGLLAAKSNEAFDGADAVAAAAHDWAFAAQSPDRQLQSTGWYRGRPTLIPWRAARSRQRAWVGFYRQLYRALRDQAPSGYRVDRDDGPVFYLGGQDVAHVVLGLERRYSRRIANEVNLYSRIPDGSVEQLAAQWETIRVAKGKTSVGVTVNNEVTMFMARMLRLSRQAGGGDEALDAVQNIFLKWNVVALTPDGLEVYALDRRAARDIRRRVLRLSTKRGLNAYELQYNLVVAFRALNEASEPWKIDEESRRLIGERLAQLSPEEAAHVLRRAGNNFWIRRGKSREYGQRRLLEFVKAQFGEEPSRALATGVGPI